MIQLSSPAPENLPVRTGKSPEKAALPKSGDGRFEKALEQSRRLSRNEDQRETNGTESGKVASETVKDSNESEKTAVSDKGAEGTASPSSGKKNAQERIAGRSPDGSSAAEKRARSGKTLLSLGKNKNRNTGKKSGEALARGAVLAAGEGSKDQSSTGIEALLQKAELKDTDSGTANASDAAIVETIETAALEADTAGALEAGGAALSENTVFQLSEETAGEGRNNRKSLKLAKKNSSASVQKAEEPKITVDDQRTPIAKDLVLKKVETAGEDNALTLEFAGTEEELPGMMLRTEGDSGAARFSLQTAEESKGAALLDRQLKNEGTAELTKNIRFVLKDNNEGEIKLILKPEALGKVRINLNLNENNIVGKIIVENNSVRQVFMNNLSDLTRALEDSGFNSAALDVSVGGGQSEGRGGFRDERPVYFTDNVLDDLEDLIPVVYDEGHSLSQINLVV